MACLQKSHDVHKSFEDTTKPRRARDVIPNSHLVQYGNFTYNKTRELNYTDCGVNVIIHFHDHKRCDEPWMWPEVERIFLHTILNSSYNYKIYEAEMGGEDMEFDRNDSQDAFYNGEDVVDKLFERAPGCPGSKKEYHNIWGPPSDSYEAEIRKRSSTDYVRRLWNDAKLECHIQTLKIYKSSLDNLLVEADHSRYVTALKAYEAEDSLEHLLTSLKNTKGYFSKEEKVVEEVKEVVILETTPVKRLYSQVVQGTNSSVQETSPKKILSVLLKPYTPDTKDNIKSSDYGSFESTPEIVNSAYSSAKSSIYDTQESPTWNYSSSPSPVQEIQNSFNCTNGTADWNDISSEETLKAPITDAQNPSTWNYPTKRVAPGYEGRIPNIQNYYNVMKCAQPAQNNPIPSVATTTANNNYQANLLHSYNIYFDNLICYYQHDVYASKLFVPLPLYRPPVLQQNYRNYTSPIVPPINKPQTCQQNQGQPNKWNKYNTQLHKTELPKFVNLNKRPTPTIAYNKYTTAPIDYFKLYEPYNYKSVRGEDDGLMTARTTETNENASTSERSVKCSEEGYDSIDEATIPVTCSASEELEKIALREYYSSNDIFSEIERQAKEQYDDYPENL